MATTPVRGKAETAGPNRPIAEAPCRLHPHLLQINCWSWLGALSRQAGRLLTLGDVDDDEWDRIREWGFDLVYLMGIWQRSLAGRRLFRTDPPAFRVFDHALPDWTVADIVGSPFSIAGYVPDQRIGDWAQIDAVRAKLAARGMRLILDFVPNHVGPDHGWIDHHPDYLMQGRPSNFQNDPSAFVLVEPENQPPLFVARGRDPYFAPWADTVQIDHFSPGARAALVAELVQIGRHCDGVRCDMAMLVLNDVFAGTWAHLLQGRAAPISEFWTDAIAALPADFIWIAETYWDMEPRLQALGFNYTYDKRLYDRLIAADAGQIRAHLGADVLEQSRMARFVENHDEPRAMATFGRQRLPGLTALIATLPGLRFFHEGQFEGRTIHLPMPLDHAAAEPADTALLVVCRRILQIADDPVFHDGAWALVPVGGDQADALIAYEWRLGTALRLVVLNIGAYAAQGWVGIAEAPDPAPAYQFRDLLDDQSYIRDRDGLVERGLYVRLEACQAHVFAISPTG